MLSENNFLPLFVLYPLKKNTCGASSVKNLNCPSNNFFTNFSFSILLLYTDVVSNLRKLLIKEKVLVSFIYITEYSVNDSLYLGVTVYVRK